MNPLLALVQSVFGAIVLALPIAVLAGFAPEILTPTMNEYGIFTVLCTAGGFVNLLNGLTGGALLSRD